jgi:hypothetical protein
MVCDRDDCCCGGEVSLTMAAGGFEDIISIFSNFIIKLIQFSEFEAINFYNTSITLP